MARVERLGNVGRAELDNDALLALGRVALVSEAQGRVGAVGRLSGEDIVDDRLGERARLEEELEEVALQLGRLDER
jgi:hypothetical protein